MIVKINGEPLPCSRAGEDYERMVDYAERCGFYGPIDKTRDVIMETKWYQHEGAPSMADLNKVEAVCNDDPFCWMDAANRLIMDSTPVTQAIYRFITHRTAIIRDGIENNFLPWDMEALIWTVSQFV